MLAGNEAERLQALLQDIKFVNNLLSRCGLDAPFPFSQVVADPSRCSPSELYSLEASVKILTVLLNCKQVLCKTSRH